MIMFCGILHIILLWQCVLHYSLCLIIPDLKIVIREHFPLLCE